MKAKHIIMSCAAVLVAVASLANAQTTSVDACASVFPSDAKKLKSMLRYTVNYAVAGSVDPGTESAYRDTLISVANVKTPPSKASTVIDTRDCVRVVFKDNSGAAVGQATGLVKKSQSAEFATAQLSSGNVIAVEYVATVPTTATGGVTPLPSFEGKAEVYSKNPLLQIAAFLVNDSSYISSSLPVQKSSQATKGGH